MLIKHGANIDIVDASTHYYCKTPLSRACFEGSLDMVKLLLGNKADINYTGGLSYPPLFTSLYSNEDEIAKYLLQDDDVDVKWTDIKGIGALHGAACKPDMIPEILKKGALIDGHSIWGTALHIASRNGSLKSIEALLENDPKPTVDYVYGDDGYFKDEIGYTPLQLVCLRPNPDCLKLLLKAGADPKFRNKNGDDAVDILLRTKTAPDEAQKCLQLLLSKPYRVPVDQVNEQGQTRLHSVREETPVPIVRLLVEARTPLNAQDHNGYTPLAVAIREGNESVANYLINQDAGVNVFSSSFGSILHLAVAKGSLSLVKVLVDSGADCETVDPEFGESLLYTSLGIKEDSKLKKMVRYLVDEAKVPINKLGGELAYPIIRAAYMTRTRHVTGIKMLKFLIRRKAQVNVADSQGRRAVHFACTAQYDDGIKALADAGADIDVGDKFGRKPIHFAASAPYKNCVEFLLDKFNDAYNVDVKDHNNWTPLLWAARSGDQDVIAKLIARGADVWVQGWSHDVKPEWSALKLMRFANQNPCLKDDLEPKQRTRANQDGQKEEWDDDFHKSKVGHKKVARCKSCLMVSITGLPFQLQTRP
jgi:ankyrin repeat protein